MTGATWLPRVAGIVGGVLVAKAAELGVTLDPVEATGLVLAVYAFLHRAISKKVNPGDATKTVLIQADKDVVEGPQFIRPT